MRTFFLKSVVMLMILLFSINNAIAKSDDEQILIDIEGFKNELQKVGSVHDNQSPFKSKVKILNSKYLISPGDNISVSVYGEPEFSQSGILIRPDGYITIEPFGEMNVAGKDIEELTSILSNKLKVYLLNPKVSIKVNSLHNAKVYIYGAVQKPGLYQQERMANTSSTTERYLGTTMPELTLASVISNAGGVKYNADLRHVKVTNNETGRNEELDLFKLIENGDVSQDIYLRSGDSIYIPSYESDAQISDKEFMLIASSSLAPVDFPVRVIGAVARPGVYNLKSSSPGVNSAIAIAEGYTIDANTKAIAVQRITPQGNVSTIYVDPSKNDMILRPNDIVMIANKSTTMANRGFEFFYNLINPAGRFADSYNSWAEMFNPTRRYNNVY